MTARVRKKLAFMVAVPIPRFGRDRRPLEKAKIDKAIREVVEAFS